jgi:hypothetical protein
MICLQARSTDAREPSRAIDLPVASEVELQSKLDLARSRGGAQKSAAGWIQSPGPREGGDVPKPGEVRVIKDVEEFRLDAELLGYLRDLGLFHESEVGIEQSGIS